MVATNYIILLLIVTGCLNLIVDVNRYKEAGMVREKRFVRFLGWLNIAIGLLLFFGGWVIDKFL